MFINKYINILLFFLSLDLFSARDILQSSTLSCRSPSRYLWSTCKLKKCCQVESTYLCLFSIYAYVFITYNGTWSSVKFQIVY